MFYVAIGSARWVYMIDLPIRGAKSSLRHIHHHYYLLSFSLSSLQRCLTFLFIPIKFLVDQIIAFPLCLFLRSRSRFLLSSILKSPQWKVSRRAVALCCRSPAIKGLDPLLDSPRRSPRVSLPHVETLLNMHQYSGLFDRDSPEHLKAVESSAESINSHSSNTRTNGSILTNSDSMTTEWSSAVGHAATGKSGRVIHNLQEDIARLTRECSVYRSRAEETQRMNDAFKTQVQNMTERLRNLEQAHETNLHSISRKDKKIEELRAEVQSEKDRRIRAETETNKFHQLMDESRDDFNRKCAELQEIANHARTQYDVLAKAGQRERADQQRRVKAIRDEIDALKSRQEEKSLHLERLDAVIAQKNREIEIGRENFDKLFEVYESYKKAHDEEVHTLVERGRQGDANLDAALASLKETEDRMKWAIQVKNEVKGAN